MSEFIDEDESLHSSEQSSELSISRMTSTGPGISAMSASSSSSTDAKAVRKSKRVLLGFLFVSAVSLAVVTYFYLRSEEKKDFEQKFYDMNIEVLKVVHHEAVNVYRSVEAVSTAFTSYAESENSNSTLPFVSLPDFEARGDLTNLLANSLMLAMAPIITADDRQKWEDYSVSHQRWVKDGLQYSYEDEAHQQLLTYHRISEEIFRHEYNETKVREVGPGPYMPVWQMSPVPLNPTIVNFNLLSNPVFERIHHGMVEAHHPVMSEVTELDWLYREAVQDDVTHPHSFLLYPIFEDIALNEDDRGEILGAIVAVIPWDHYLENILAEDQGGFIVVFTDTCGDSFTYEVNGPKATFLGYGDHHDRKYNYMEKVTPFVPFEQLEFSETHKHCEYDLHIYGSQALEDSASTPVPFICASAMLMVFFVTFVVFAAYDGLVQKRQKKVQATANRANAVVKSLFPATVRDRIMEEAEEKVEKEHGGKGSFFHKVPTHQLKTFLDDGVAKTSTITFDGKPIADLFPEATIMFADIAGFTAWSSEREPAQVFQLLETLYNNFDEIAARRRVFKVETIGDCYVAVAGLPNPRSDHAVIMARFARDILFRMNDLTKKLEVELGPGTGDLCLRVGLHSGPVTAGVLRGDRARFQLFGDTVNTASRIESTGIKNRIHVSQETHDSLAQQSKKSWLKPRQEKIVAKGKGELQTYWLDLTLQTASGESVLSGSTDSTEVETVSETRKEETEKVKKPDSLEKQPSELIKTTQEPLNEMLSATSKRLVKWNSEMLIRLLKQVVSRRNATSKVEGERKPEALATGDFNNHSNDQTVIDEVKEIITLPRFNARAARNQEDVKNVYLPPVVIEQVKEFVTIVACMYRSNPFHNFEHASHVTMSVIKLLSRIVAPDEILKEKYMDDEDIHVKLHDHTYGITSDPLTQFAVVMSALIHDVDHSGVPNSQLVKEKASVALFYNNQSVAEQNSVDLAWELLFDEAFTDLRNTIAPTQQEMNRFRQLIVNAVMATDIVDKELKKLRNDRWDKAFQISGATQTMEDVNRKATIVIEHLIQASDVAHTMQHWHIYQRWNERFFEENMKAFKEGRSDKNPLDFWYKGELGFFDFYIIPLAKKLKDCGVFGVSSDEYLNYATRNRQEWEERGQDIVEDLKKKYGDGTSS